MRTLRATVSGSFTRHIDAIQRAVCELMRHGVRVLSPERPVIVDELEGFLFVESDRHRLVKLVQDRHLASIRDSDFLWLEASGGYVGQSAALELGFAIASGVPIYSTATPDDLTMRQYVRKVPSIEAAITLAGKRRSRSQDSRELSLLVDPIAAAQDAAEGIDCLQKLLTKKISSHTPDDLARLLRKERGRVLNALDVPVVP